MLIQREKDRQQLSTELESLQHDLVTYSLCDLVTYSLTQLVVC